MSTNHEAASWGSSKRSLGTIELEEFNQPAKLQLGIDVGVAAAGELSFLQERMAELLESGNLPFHAGDLEGEMVKAGTVAVEELAPAARLAIGLDQLKCGIAELEKGQLRARLG